MPTLLRRSALALALAACASNPPLPVVPDVDVEALAALPEAGEAAISPDGTHVAYVTDASGARELVVERLGCERECVRATNLREGVTRPVFSPDSRTAYFLADRGGNERYDVFRLDVASGAVAQVTKTDVSETDLAPSPDGKSLAFAGDPDTAFRFDLHILDLASGAVRRVTTESVNVVKPIWDPDGTSLAGTRTGDGQTGSTLVSGLAQTRRATIEPGPGRILWAEAYSRDGFRLLARTVDRDGFLQLAIVSVFDGSVRVVTRAPGDVEYVAWAGRGPVVFARNEAGISRLYRLDRLDGVPAPIAIPEGVVTSLAIDREAKKVALTLTSSTAPARPYVLTLADGTLTALGALGAPAGLALAPTRVVEWASDGQRITGLLTLPAAPKAPLVVRVHGGPNGQSRPEFSATLQALVAAGFAVLEPNYRGSTGFGRAFEDANNLDWGGGDLRDVIAGVRWAQASGLVDPKRAGIFGGSYGGYLTLRALTAEPDVFAAGADLYGMPDLVDDYALTKDRFGDWYATEMGTPETQPALFKDRSPIHSLDRLRAPLLVLQGENDTNVPRRESDLVVGKLRERGHPVEYRVYPDEGHGFTRRTTRVDAAKRLILFFRQHLGR